MFESRYFFVMKTMNDDILSRIKRPIESDLVRLNEVMKQALSSSNPLLSQIVDYYLQTKGKQIRAILVLLAARMTGTVKEETIYGAAAVELLHNATLIHDDVVDESKLRRGRETLNAVWDNRVAVLAGDYFVSKVLRMALLTGETSVIAVLGELGAVLAQGEIDQISVVQKKEIDEEAYFRVIRQKTASLFKVCMQIGALTAGATTEQQNALMCFGEKLGLCFQIRDDIFDYFDSKETGKTSGCDLKEGKVTLPLIYALTHGAEPERSEIAALIRKQELTGDDVRRLAEYAKKSGGIGYAESVMARLRDEAAEVLRPFLPSDVATALLAVLDYTLERRK